MWKNIPNHPGYKVNESGEVRSYLRTPKVLKQATSKEGYNFVRLKQGNKYPIVYIHQLVCSVWNGERPEGMMCLHEDDNKTNNHYTNLRWGTRSDNTDDLKRNGGRKVWVNRYGRGSVV